MGKGNDDDGSKHGPTKEQYITRLKALQNDAEGERKAFGLARPRSQVVEYE